MEVDNNDSGNEESQVLQHLLSGSQTSIEDFFENIYQTSCAIFSRRPDTSSAATTASPPWNEEAVQADPHGELLRQRWPVLLQLLEEARRQNESSLRDPESSRRPLDNPCAALGTEALLFHHQQVVSLEQSRARYNGSLFAGLLDGCSVVVNHADGASPWMAALCTDLQQSFPHAYANVYLTPPASQAVPPHADDRDVLVLQVLGQKQWKVYERIPVPYPYPHEQVGKTPNLPVPEAVLQGPLLMERTLQPGDVLYMPRGYVHEAKTVSDESSLHVTVALATHDWSLAGVVSAAHQKLLSSVVDYRKALPRQLGTRPWDQVENGMKQDLERELDDAYALLRRQVTAEAIHDALGNKYQLHNRRAQAIRSAVLSKAKASTIEQGVAQTLSVVGREASERLGLSSKLRVATPEEKASVVRSQDAAPLGLQVRAEIHQDLMLLVQTLKSSQPGACFQVNHLKSLLLAKEEGSLSPEQLCEVTMLCFARQLVELGAFAIVE